MLKLHVTTKYLSRRKGRLWNVWTVEWQKTRGGDLVSHSDRVAERIATLEKSHTVNPWRVVFPEIVSLVLTSTCWPNTVMAGRTLKSMDTRALCRSIKKNHEWREILELREFPRRPAAWHVLLSVLSVLAYVEFIFSFNSESHGYSVS